MLRRSLMPTDRELLSLCLRLIEDSPEQAFDRAMLIEALKAKLKPERWAGLTEAEKVNIALSCGCADVAWMEFADAIEEALKKKNA
jgi:hypothetical protein